MRENEYAMEDTEYVVLKQEDAQTKVITNQLLNNLSVEAKFVLDAILNTPGELSEFLFADNPTKKKVYKYLKLMGWKMPIIQRTVRELNVFTKDILH